MKRFGLKVANGVGHIVASFGAGFVFGKLMGLIFSRILTEETMESKPVLFWGMYVLYLLLLAGFALTWSLIWPASIIYDWIDKKIDDFADEKEWD